MKTFRKKLDGLKAGLEIRFSQLCEAHTEIVITDEESLNEGVLIGFIQL